MLPFVINEKGENLPVGTIYGIGRNYSEHAKELGNAIPTEEPVIFLKAPSSVRSIRAQQMAFSTESYHFECELVLRIGTHIPMNSKNLNWHSVQSVALGLDLTRREKQNQLKAKGLPWTLAKSFCGASVLSPFVDLTEDILATHDTPHFEFKFAIGEEIKQVGDTRQMIFDVPFILGFLNSFNHLYPGDLIFTGTPAGVGPIHVKDKFSMELIRPSRKWTGVL